jgi:hypothetical protein
LLLLLLLFLSKIGQKIASIFESLEERMR